MNAHEKGIEAAFKAIPDYPPTTYDVETVIRAYLEASGMVMVPREPEEGLLRSMAVRYDHGLGVPGYYDQPVFGAENVGHEKRLASTITTMRQLHEEVVGTGFYKRLCPFSQANTEGETRG